MKKIFITFFVVLISLLVVDVIYKTNTTQTVLLSGRILGFEIETYKETEKNGDLIPTSSQKLGIVTFVKKETHEFAALGHSAIQNSEETNIDGICHEVSINKIEKSYRNFIGCIHGILKSDEKVGTINKNNKFGVFGTIDNIQENIYNEIRTASRYEIEVGDAELLIALDNDQLKSYKLEVIQIDYLSNNKNIKIRIKDDSLISQTGGIVQGMSGAPIVQNGKLIGAINYADLKTPKEAYAIFIDKLI